MTIETQYNAGDRVWLMDDNKPGVHEIEEITIKIGPPNVVHPISIEYKIRAGGSVRWYIGGLFTTKEALLQSL